MSLEVKCSQNRDFFLPLSLFLFRILFAAFLLFFVFILDDFPQNPLGNTMNPIIGGWNWRQPWGDGIHYEFGGGLPGTTFFSGWGGALIHTEISNKSYAGAAHGWHQNGDNTARSPASGLPTSQRIRNDVMISSRMLCHRRSQHKLP